MEDFFYEIQRGLDARVYHLCLGMSLCIPDICAALESENGETNGRKYKEWYNKYVGNKFRMNAADCYYFRCSFLHQGSTQHHRSQFERIIFVEPNPMTQMHNNIFNNVLNIDLEIFCRGLIDSAREWLEDVKNNEHYLKNKNKAFKRYEMGISPYIVGIPVYG